jgi:D-alanyl-D-alanine carboxypeptidase (penicillin-binding protein 5/6)
MKRLLSIIFFLILAAGLAFGGLILVTPEPPQPPVFGPAPATKGKSAALYWANESQILAEKNGDMKIYPASTTKMMTCILALEDGKSRLNDNAVITPLAMHQDGTNLGISPQNPISLHELLYGMMLISGNDAAVAAAETTAGSVPQFVSMMNAKAAAVGATHTHFANPNGLTDPNHYSTASDMVKIGAYCMQNPAFRDIVGRAHYSMTYRDGTIRIVDNRNEFLESGYPGANGIKTGMTDAAGECLVASAERNGQLLVVSFYDDTNRWNETKTWLDYGFACIQAEQDYEAKLKAEPKIFKWVNQLMGKEPKEDYAAKS